MATQTDSQMSQKTLKIGDRYLVQRSNNTWHSAEIIEVRQDADKYEQDADKYEYYVHYDGCNRRLDEWVHSSRFDVTSAHRYNFVVHGADQMDQALTRNQKRKYDEVNHIQKRYAEMDPTTAALEKEHEAITKVKYIERIQFGKWEIGTWYYSPYPGDQYKMTYIFQTISGSSSDWQHKVENLKRSEKVRRSNNSEGGKQKQATTSHSSTEDKPDMAECEKKKPPGKQIYRKGTHSVFEVDGKEHMLYCQCLCLLSKVFLDHKSLHFNVEPFLFYVLTEIDEQGAHLIGYFSKEKESYNGNNLACILIVPPYQGKGFGRFLIEFSYELSKIEHIVGSPERPLSDLGKRSYQSYWSWVILQTLKNHGVTSSVEKISQMTSIAPCDIISTLQSLNMVQLFKGEHTICATAKLVDKWLHSSDCRKPRITVDISRLRWVPPKKQIKSKR